MVFNFITKLNTFYNDLHKRNCTFSQLLYLIETVKIMVFCNKLEILAILFNFV